MEIKFRLEYWPLLTGFWFIATFVTSYVVSVKRGDVYFFFPYISDTGTMAPESCIFGQMLNLGSLFLLITMYIRYRLVALCKHRGSAADYKCWNNWSNLFGLLSCIGMSVVANFQETSVLSMHFFGAFLAFGIGSLYCIIHAYLTWLSYSGKFLKCLRILLSMILIPLYVSTVAATMISFNEFHGNQFKWTKRDAGYCLHLVATFSEWSMAIAMVLYIISFYSEFKTVEVDEISFIPRLK